MKTLPEQTSFVQYAVQTADQPSLSVNVNDGHRIVLALIQRVASVEVRYAHHFAVSFFKRECQSAAIFRQGIQFALCHLSLAGIVA